MDFTTILAAVTFLVGVAGAVKAGTRLTRSDMAQTIEVQHTVWEEQRVALEDCRAELTRLRGP